MERESEFVTLRFALTPTLTHRESEGLRSKELLIATTRPELLPACVAVFVHPDDQRYREWVGKRLRVPLFEQAVPVLIDPAADPEKGTGAVMCCTFGDAADVAWQRKHQLPLIQAINAHGQMTSVAGRFADLPILEARRQIKQALASRDLIVDRQPTHQTIRVHETGTDLARFVHLEELEGDCMLYATRLGSEYILTMIFDAETPFSMIRRQANTLARNVKQPPDTAEEFEVPASVV